MTRTRALSAGLVAMLACLAALSLPAASPAQEPDPAMRRLLAWEGRYPLDGVPDFFHDPATAPLIRKTIPAAVLQKILDLHVNTPFERSGDILYAHLCKAHDCPSYAADIYLDARCGSLQVCLSEYDAARKRNTDTWVGKTVRTIEDGSCTGDLRAFTRFRDPDERAAGAGPEGVPGSRRDD